MRRKLSKTTVVEYNIQRKRIISITVILILISVQSHSRTGPINHYQADESLRLMLWMCCWAMGGRVSKVILDECLEEVGRGVDVNLATCTGG